jgi:hypothetical protein
MWQAELAVCTFSAPSESFSGRRFLRKNRLLLRTQGDSKKRVENSCKYLDNR